MKGLFLYILLTTTTKLPGPRVCFNLSFTWICTITMTTVSGIEASNYNLQFCSKTIGLWFHDALNIRILFKIE